MKAIVPIIAMMTAPVMVATAPAAELGALQGYLPTDGTMKAGVAVSPQFTPEFAKLQQELVKKLQALTPEKQQAFDV